MSKKFFLSFLFSFVLITGVVFTFIEMQKKKEDLSILKKSTQIKTYKYRKYRHIQIFYKGIAKKAVALSLKYDVPPAAVLAIAGVESGYGRGYVASITGNILSLGAKSNEDELPSLYLPNLKTDTSKVFYGDEIQKHDKDTLEWKQRPGSLKKDYRPKGIAGTINQLDYLDKNPQEKHKANLACIEDFVKVWIHKNKKFKPFIAARQMLDEEVKKNSQSILFSRDLNIKFIYTISGKENSFNYRKTWAPKVIKIMDNIGLVALSKDLHVKKTSFNEVW